MSAGQSLRHFPLPKNISYSQSHCFPFKYLWCIEFPGNRTVQPSGIGTVPTLFETIATHNVKHVKQNQKHPSIVTTHIFPVLHLKDPQSESALAKVHKNLGLFICIYARFQKQRVQKAFKDVVQYCEDNRTSFKL